MRKHIAILAACICATAACSDAPIAADSPPPPSPVQRCMNISGALEAPEEGLWGYTVRLSDLDQMKAAGFDTIRLPVKWSAHTRPDAPFDIDPAMLARVDQIIDHALSIDLQVILNVHHYDELNTDPDGHEPRLTTIWQQLSRHYAGYPSGLIFETINEPYDAMTPARTDALNSELISMIRQRHPDRWVIAGTAWWGNLDGLLKSNPPQDARTLLTFHYYEPYKFTHQGAFFADPPPPTGKTFGTPRERESVVRDMQKAAKFRDRYAMPLLLGEFGVYAEVPLAQRAAWTRHTRQAAEAEGFGWCHWGFATTFKSYDLERDAWIDPIRDALIDP